MKDVFICHAGADKAWVRDLCTRLEAERIGNRLIEVFFDEWDVDHGENIVSKIDEGLKTARFCAVVLSPAMLSRDWPNAEWTARFMSDPSGRRSQLLPILLHEKDSETGDVIDIPMLLRPLRRFDFTKESNFESEFEELIRRLRGEKPKRGGGGARASNVAQSYTGAEAPDDVNEMLCSNLFAIDALPDVVWSDLATTQKYTDVWKSLSGRRVAPFVLADGRLYSFFEPTSPDNPFKSFLMGSSRRSEKVSEWLRDHDRARMLVRLFNDALQEHAYHLRIRNIKSNRKQFFCPVFDGKPRTFAWGGGGRAKTIAKLGERPDKSTLGIHCSAKMRFLVLGQRVFLLVEPGWMFTSDGVTPLKGKQVTILSTLYNGKERNQTVLRNVLMWSMLLANGGERIRIPVGSVNIVLDPIPAMANISVGIDGDSMKLDRVLESGAGSEVAASGDADDDLDHALLLAVTSSLTADEDEDALEEELAQ